MQNGSCLAATAATCCYCCCYLKSSYSPLLSLPASLPTRPSPYPLLIPLAPKQQMFIEGNLFLCSLKAAHFETIGAHLYILKCMGALKVVVQPETAQKESVKIRATRLPPRNNSNSCTPLLQQVTGSVAAAAAAAAACSTSSSMQHHLNTC